MTEAAWKLSAAPDAWRGFATGDGDKPGGARVVWARNTDAAAGVGDAPVVLIAALDGEFGEDGGLPQPGEDDRREAAGYPDGVPRKAFLRRRAVLRLLAGRRLGLPAAEIVIVHDAVGAPRLARPAGALHVSVAARGPQTAFALAGSPIGVDLEPVGAPAEPAWNILHPAEGEALAGLAPEARHEAFLRLWTMKEAALKRLGLGLRIEPAAVAVSLADGIARVAPHPPLRGEWHGCSLAGRPVIVACSYA